MLFAFAAWATPLHAASAQPSKEEQAIFINYEQFHKTPIQVVPKQKENKSNPKNRQPLRVTVPGTPGAYDGRDYSKEEVENLIVQYSQEYGISHDLPRRIAYCESGYNSASKNRSSSASGVFQYLTGTWRNTPEGRQGLNVFDADANVRAAVRHIATHGTAPWNASIHCWSR